MEYQHSPLEEILYGKTLAPGWSPKAIYLVKQYLYSPFFTHHTSEVNRLVTHKRGSLAENDKQRLKGEIFEWIAYLSVLSGCPPQHVLLDPQETHSLYERELRKRHPLIDLTVPDGLSLYPFGRKTFVSGTYEYTMGTKITGRKRFQLSRQQNRKVVGDIFNGSFVLVALSAFLRENYPHLPSGLTYDTRYCKSVLVVPEGGPDLAFLRRSIIHRVPMTRYQLSFVMGELFPALNGNTNIESGNGTNAYSTP